jgi:hypothetical protein
MTLKYSLCFYFSENLTVILPGGCKIRQRLAVSEKAAQNFKVDRFNLRKLRELEVKKQYQIKISNRFAALEKLNDNDDIRTVLGNIKGYIKISAKENLSRYGKKQHKQCFDEEGSRF